MSRSVRQMMMTSPITVPQLANRLLGHEHGLRNDDGLDVLGIRFQGELAENGLRHLGQMHDVSTRLGLEPGNGLIALGTEHRRLLWRGRGRGANLLLLVHFSPSVP